MATCRQEDGMVRVRAKPEEEGILTLKTMGKSVLLYRLNRVSRESFTHFILIFGPPSLPRILKVHTERTKAHFSRNLAEEKGL